MLQLIGGVVLGIILDGGVTYFVIRKAVDIIRESQADMAREAVNQLSDGILEMAPAILARAMMEKGQEK